MDGTTKGADALRSRAEAVGAPYAAVLGEEAHAELVSSIERALGSVSDGCCLPDPGEPSFVLLGRDPQAPALVMSWAADRQRAEPDSGKPDMARRVAGMMIEWKDRHPGIGMPSDKVGPVNRDVRSRV